MTNYLRLYLYGWNSSNKKWEYASIYVNWDYRPDRFDAVHKIEWRIRSSGTKRLKKFKWKARQTTQITIRGEARTTLMRQLEWISKSKVVVHLRGRYTEPGKSEDEYPIITPVLPWDGSGSMPDPNTFGAGDLEYEDYAYYVGTSINVSGGRYRAAADTETPATKRELLHEVTLVLERVDSSTITDGGYM